jgi:hypothetical protein
VGRHVASDPREAAAFVAGGPFKGFKMVIILDTFMLVSRDFHESL